MRDNTAIGCDTDNEDIKILDSSFKQFIIGDGNVQYLGGLAGRESDLIWARSKVINCVSSAER